jgi:7-cyano-7-deazaguanine synthase
MTSREPAIVLLSGGMDSAVAAALARSQGFALYALSFRYGQRHVREIEAARRVAQSLQVEKHLILEIPLGQIGGSALLQPAAEVSRTPSGAADHGGAADLSRAHPVPQDRTDSEISAGIPATYVPARNTIFLAYALAWAEVIPARHIFLGVNARDYSGYPDCRPEFVAAFEQLANLATKAGVEGEKITLHAPLIHLRKAEIVRKGIELGVEFSLTHSCYDPAPDGRACGRCDSCSLRRKGFREAGVPDPILYLG